MEARNNVAKLSSLSEWSVQHIRDIFEARTDEQSLRSIDATFSDSVNASINGGMLSREGINQLVLAMRKGSTGELKVHWQQAVEVPRDPSTNRVGIPYPMLRIRLIANQRFKILFAWLTGWILWRGVYHPRPPETAAWNDQTGRV
jgi:hypothetical protein